MTTHLPTPSPSPPPSATGPPSLSAQINTATRKKHTQLNKLIAERLPLALPPHASDPKTLHRGLAYFFQIYTAFEFAWHEVTHPELSADTKSPKNKHDPERLEVLANLRPKGLERTPRMTRDLEHLVTATSESFDFAGNFNAAIIAGINQKPHIVMAYAWVMYMAIFSGGRWIREQFANAGPEFWMGRSEAETDEKTDKDTFLARSPGFTFLSFDGDADGEDIKADFKARLAAAEAGLSKEERQDVIDAANALFGLCIGMVDELDRQIWKAKVHKFAPLVLGLILLLGGLLTLYWYDSFGYLTEPLYASGA